MKNYVLFLVFQLVLCSEASAQYDLEYFRESFHESSTKDDLHNLIDQKANETQVKRQKTIKAYKAVSETMLAEYSFSPFSKIKHFNNGVEKLESIISENPDVENRYLRLLVQLNVPKMLNYYDMINADLDFINQRINYEITSSKVKTLFKQTLRNATVDVEYLNKIEEINID